MRGIKGGDTWSKVAMHSSCKGGGLIWNHLLQAFYMKHVAAGELE